MIDHYDWAGGREAMLRFGPDDGPVVLLLPPLLEEHNRTRSFAVTMLRRLDDLGVAGMLPDLPGTGESVVPTSAMTIANMRQAVAALVAATTGEDRRVYAAAIRSGALLDTAIEVAGRWHFAPQPGPALLRELGRIKQAERGMYRPLAEHWHLDGTGSEIAGNDLSRALLAELATAELAPTSSEHHRIVRLDSDLATADLKLPGAPLWRQATPGNDAALALALATDIAGWVHQCGG